MRRSRHKAIHIDISNIKHDTTCCNILPDGLPITVACDICQPKLDIHTKKSSQKYKKERLKHKSNKCKQYWITKWSGGNNITTGESLKHIFTRRYLNIEQDVKIEFTNLKKRKSTDDTQIEQTPQSLNHSQIQDSLPTYELAEDVEAQRPTDPPSGHPLTTDIPTRSVPLSDPPTPNHSQIQDSSSQTDSLYTRILIRDLKKLEREAALGRKILECRKNKQYKSNKLGRLLHGVALAHCTKIGVVTMEKIITLSTAAFFANLGFSDEIVSDVVASCPSATELKNLMVELAADCILITSKEIADKELALMADKGEDNGKSASFVKLMAYYVSKKVGVKVVCFGIETAGNASKDAACGIDHSLTVFEYGTDQRRILFSMSMTDAGGGGVGSSLVANLALCNRAIDNCNYL